MACVFRIYVFKCLSVKVLMFFDPNTLTPKHPNTQLPRTLFPRRPFGGGVGLYQIQHPRHDRVGVDQARQVAAHRRIIAPPRGELRPAQRGPVAGLDPIQRVVVGC